MKYILLIAVLFIVGCSENTESTPLLEKQDSPTPNCCKPGPPGGPSPKLMYSVSEEELWDLGIKYRVSNKQARAASLWLAQCKPDFDQGVTLHDYAIETLDDGSKKYYRFFPILAHAVIDIEKLEVKKSNPLKYNMPVDLIASDLFEVPCNIPDDYQIIGYVTAMEPMDKSEVEKDFGELGGEVTEQCEPFDVDQIKVPAGNTTYVFSETCVNGVTERVLKVIPENKFGFSHLNARPTASALQCETVELMLSTLETLNKGLQSAINEDLKKFYEEEIESTKERLNFYSQQEGMVTSLILNIDSEVDELLNEYRSLNSHLDLDIRVSEEFSYSGVQLVYDKSNVDPLIKDLLKPLNLVIPGWGMGSGPYSGQVTLSVVDACFATDFKMTEEAFKQKVSHLKTVQ